MKAERRFMKPVQLQRTTLQICVSSQQGVAAERMAGETELSAHLACIRPLAGPHIVIKSETDQDLPEQDDQPLLHQASEQGLQKDITWKDILSVGICVAEMPAYVWLLADLQGIKLIQERRIATLGWQNVDRESGSAGVEVAGFYGWPLGWEHALSQVYSNISPSMQDVIQSPWYMSHNIHWRMDHIPFSAPTEGCIPPRTEAPDIIRHG